MLTYMMVLLYCYISYTNITRCTNSTNTIIRINMNMNTVNIK